MRSACMAATDSRGARPLLCQTLLVSWPLGAPCSAPRIIQTQLQEVLGSVVYADFPEAWPGLLESIMGHLTSNVSG